MKTKVVFWFKNDEPIEEMIHIEFKNIPYVVEKESMGRWTILTLVIEKELEPIDDDSVIIDGFECQYESIQFFQ